MSGTRQLGPATAHFPASLAGPVHAEWTKLRTMPSTGWLLLGIVAATVLVGAINADSVKISLCGSPSECVADTTRVSLAGVGFGQAIVAVVALLAVTNEYGTRMISTTLAANPHRVTVVLTKAAVVTGAVLGAGALGVVGSLVAGRLILPGNGFAGPSPADGPTLRAAAGSVLYLGLIALLSFGVGAIVRDTAGAITIVLAVLYLPPLAGLLVSHPVWHDRLQRFSPTTAGQSIQATIGLDDLPIGPWAGLGVLAAYATATMLLATALFTIRDA